MKKFTQIRQGDVLLVLVEIPRPEGIQPKEEVILAEGEITGHAHRLKAKEIYEWSKNGQRYIQVAGKQNGELSHEEHDPLSAAIVSPNITYKIVPQKEWDLSEQWRKVKD